VVVLAVALGPATGTAAADAPDCSAVSYNGDGTTSNPFEVGNVDQLQCIESQGLDASYEVVSDIDATGTSTWNGGDGFKPIGKPEFFGSSPFNGTFDGNRHTITGLTVDRGGENGVGLFGGIGSAGEIKKTTLESVNLVGNAGVGAFTGRMARGSNLTESSASGIVDDTFNLGNTGGLVGVGRGTITRSFATVDVNSGNNAGGLAGFNNDGSITDSYARGDVNGGGDVGSLAGVNSGTVTRSYSTGSVSGPATVVGGLIGDFEGDGGTVTNSYWDIPASGQTDSRGGTGLGDSSDTPPADEMTGDEAPANMAGFDFTDTWETVTSPDDYPILAFQSQDSGGSVVDNYRNSNGNVDTGGLQRAINDFIQNNIDTGDLQAVINAFIQSR